MWNMRPDVEYCGFGSGGWGLALVVLKLSSGLEVWERFSVECGTKCTVNTAVCETGQLD